MAATDLPASDQSPAVAAAPLSGLALILAGFAMALVNFIVVLDITITNVAVPHIAGSLAVTPSQGTWVITSYAVAEAIVVPLSGWLAARFGTVRWLIVSLSGFGLFSLLCGFAPTIQALIVFRVFQGVSGGALMPLTQTMMVRIFPPEKQAAAMGLWATTTIAAPIFGPILGGWISDNWSWPWVFYMNLPVVVFCLLNAMRYLPRFETARLNSPIDVVGLLLLVTWVGAIQVVLDTGREHDWFNSTWIVSLSIVALIGFAVFVIWEWFAAHPVVNIRLLRDRSLAASALSMSLAYAAMFSSIVLIPLWLQQVKGYTAGDAGLILGTQGMSAILLAPIAAMLLNRVDPRLTISIGIFWMGLISLMRMRWSVESDYLSLVLPQFLTGVGMPFFFVGVSALSISKMRQQDVASAAGLLTFSRTMFGAVATAMATSLWISTGQVERAELVGVMNQPEVAARTLEQAGLSPMQSLAALEQMLEAQALTNSALYVFGLAGFLFVVAGSAVWFAPEPRGKLDPSAGH